MEMLPGKKFKIGKGLMDLNKEKVIHLLETHLDVFTWDMNDHRVFIPPSLPIS